MEVHLLDSFTMKQSDIDFEAKTRDASMLSIESNSILQETKQPQIPQELMVKLQANDTLQNLFLNLNEILEYALSASTDN